MDPGAEGECSSPTASFLVFVRSTEYSYDNYGVQMAIQSFG